MYVISEFNNNKYFYLIWIFACFFLSTLAKKYDYYSQMNK